MLGEGCAALGSDWERKQSRVLTRMPSCISHVPIEVSAHKSPAEGLRGRMMENASSLQGIL